MFLRSFLNQFHQNAVCARGVEEGDELSFRAASGVTVENAQSQRPHLAELRFEIVDFVADMMQSLASFLQEAAHRGVGAHRLQQFDAGISYRQERNGYALIRHLFAGGGIEAQSALIELKRIRYGTHRDSKMIYLHDSISLLSFWSGELIRRQIP